MSNGKIVKPLIWHIYPTNNCCLNCSFCIMKKERQNKCSLDTMTYSRAVFDAWRNGARTIHFSGGGEPLLHQDTKDMLATAKSLGLETALSTNGVYVSNDTIKFVDNPRISLNASNRETYNKITGTYFFDKIIDNIKSIECRKKIGLAFLIVKENYKEIYEFCKLASDLDVGWVHIRPAYLDDEEQNKELLEIIDDVEVQCKNALNDFRNIDIFYRVDKFDGFWNEKRYKCRCTPLLAVLKASGKFCICQDRTDIEFGDYKNLSFEDIWGKQDHSSVLQETSKCKIRCVETKKNEYIENIFIKDMFKRNVL